VDDVAVRVGVLLGEPAGWLADAAAFDAAGADALWLDAGPEWDVMALTAAVAAVTYRARLVVPAPGTPARTLDTVDRLSAGRLVLLTDEPGTFHRVPGRPGWFADGDERWTSVPAPDNRASWRELRADAVRDGASGVVVPAGPRLLDLLRNPDDPEERHDLLLAQG
jgi:hypothetical protein